MSLPRTSGLRIYAGMDIRRSVAQPRPGQANPMQLVTVLYQQKLRSPEETESEDQVKLYYSEDIGINGTSGPKRFPGILPFQMEVNLFLQANSSSTEDTTANVVLPPGSVVCEVVIEMFATSKLTWADFGSRSPLGKTRQDCIAAVDGGGLSDELTTFLSRLVDKASSPDGLQNLNVMSLPGRPRATISGPLETNIVVYVAYLFLWPYIRLVRDVVTEKEKQLKEYLLIMGIPSMALLLSWFLLYFIASGVVSMIAVWMLSGTMFAATLESDAYFFLLLMTFATSMLLFGIAITPIFGQTKTAAASATLIYLLLSVGKFIRAMVSEDTLDSATALSFILDRLDSASSLVVFMASLHQVVQFEATTAAIRSIAWTTVAGPCKTMLLQSAGYLVLGWYLENVFPRTYGVQQKWYFVVLPSYWFPKTVDPNVTSSNDGEASEFMPLANVTTDDFDDRYDETLREVPLAEYIQHFKPTLLVDRLSKRYPNGKEALKGVSFGVKKGEIFGLLGPNGAGKSTTLSILCGMLSPTSGDAYVGGSLCVSTDPEAIRRSLSVCFQQNILFDDLTVWEHLGLVCALKESLGIKTVAEETWDNKLRQFGLAEKRHALAKTLSGGQKRKLSLVLALLDSARVILLDEPTAGMDLKARLDTWDALQRVVKHRAVILTTHSMQEAQALCENIGIVADGKLKCCGSSLFLQEKFGVGYKLTVVHPDEPREREGLAELSVEGNHANTLLKVIRQYVPEAEVVSDNKWETRFQLKNGKENSFSALFTELEALKQQRVIKGYAVAATDLEDVFVKVTEGEDVYYHAKDDVIDEAGDGNKKSPADIRQGVDESRVDLQIRSLPLWKQVLTQLRALLIKRWKMTVRDKKAMLAQYLGPIVLFAILMAVLEHLFSFGGSIEVLTRLPRSAAGSSLFVASTIDARSAVEDVIAHVDNGSHPIVFDANVITKEAMLDAIMVRNLTTFFAGVFVSGVNWTSGSVEGAPAMDYSLYYNQTVSRSLPVALEWISQAFCKALAEQQHHSTDHCELSVSKGVFPLLSTLKTDEHDEPSAEDDIALAVTPEEAITIMRRIMMGFYLLITVNSIVSYYVAPIVKEKEYGLKRLQYQHIEAKHTSLVYWTSNMVFDYTGYLVASAAIGVVLTMFSESLTNDILLSWMLCLVLFGLAMLPFTYLLSLVFASHSSAQSYMSYVSLFQIVAASFVFVMSNFPGLCTKVHTASIFLHVLPLYTLGIAILDIATYSWSPIRRQCLQGFASNILDNPIAALETDPSVWDWDVTGQNAYALVAAAIGYTMLLLVFDQQQMYPTLASHRLRKAWNQVQRWLLCRRHAGYSEADQANSACDEESPDMVRAVQVSKVYNPRKKVAQTASNSSETNDADGGDDNDSTGAIINQSGQVVALNDVSFTVEKEDCVALLGVNGSGKSTMFEILTAGISPTSGKALIDNCDVTLEPQEAAARFGYCPQGNILFNEMSVREHLELFYQLQCRGYNSLRLERALVDALMTKLALFPVENTTAQHLSGGNKRRLMLALSLLSDHTSLLLLDEPSAGVDVVARRLMWRVLYEKRQSVHRTSCLFTTHSMEEAEAVCANAVVLFKGKLVWSGSIPDLKQHAARGVSISMRLDTVAVWQPERVQLYTDKLRQWLAARSSSNMAVATALQDDNLTAQDLERAWQLCHGHLHPRNDSLLAVESQRQGQEWLSGLRARLDQSDSDGSSSTPTQQSYTMSIVEFVKEWLLREAFVRLEVELFKEQLSQTSGSPVKPVKLQQGGGSSGSGNSGVYETNCTDSFGLADMFSLLESQKRAFAVAQYSVSELSLERVFEQFT